MSVFGLSTFTRYSGYGWGWSNTTFTQTYVRQESCSITNELVIAKGSKIKVRARIVSGSVAESAPNTFRIGIRKVPKAVP